MTADRLFDLLPQYLRRRDAETGEPLRALLAVLAEQVAVVEEDIEQLYDDWFIETCAEWVVPYLGDLVGYRTLRGYEDAVATGGPAARRLTARLAPRRGVADTVTARRRKGTLPLLEELAAAVAEWPARAVEFSRLLAASQPVRLYPATEEAAARRATTVHARYPDLRRGDLLDAAGSPFDELAHSAQAPRISSARRQGRYAPPAVGLFVWRLKPYSITRAPANCVDRARNLYTFSVLGNDVPLITRPVPEPSPAHVATADNVPAFISRRLLADRLADYYGPGRSFMIWRDGTDRPVPISDIVVADLSGWFYRARRRQVLVDPELGRIVFGGRSAPRRGVWVTYHHGFSDDTGGGEYPRDHVTARRAARYRVGPGHRFDKIMSAYERWLRDKENGDAGPSAVIEITNSGAYTEQFEFHLDPGEHLEVRAAEGARPVIRLLDWFTSSPDALRVQAAEPGEGDDRPPPGFVLDGLLVLGRGVEVTGPLGQLVIRHSTLVPGWSLEPGCHPRLPEEPSLVLECTTACVQVERSILGTILVLGNEVATDPVEIHLADSVLDATAADLEALSAPECRHAHAVLSVHRTTVIGEVHAHALRLGENSVFHGRVHVARRGIGCLRFSSVPDGSRTPPRYRCPPDVVRFTSTRYGTPGYCRLAAGCPPEITRGAEDGAELGVFHDLYQPQREDNLRARLEEYTPAGTDAGIVYVT